MYKFRYKSRRGRKAYQADTEPSWLAQNACSPYMPLHMIARQQEPYNKSIVESLILLLLCNIIAIFTNSSDEIKLEGKKYVFFQSLREKDSLTPCEKSKHS
jgi:hypothetical protein